MPAEIKQYLNKTVGMTAIQGINTTLMGYKNAYRNQLGIRKIKKYLRIRNHIGIQPGITSPSSSSFYLNINTTTNRIRKIFEIFIK